MKKEQREGQRNGRLILRRNNKKFENTILKKPKKSRKNVKN